MYVGPKYPLESRLTLSNQWPHYPEGLYREVINVAQPDGQITYPSLLYAAAVHLDRFVQVRVGRLSGITRAD